MAKAANHIAAPVVIAFQHMRDYCCPHYTGMKDQADDVQCAHEDNPRCNGNWCAMDVCPVLREHARAESVGWD